MKRKQQAMLTLLCSTALLGNSVIGLAQDKPKPADKAETHVFVRQDGKVVEVPGGGAWVTRSDGSGNGVATFTTTDGSNVAFATAGGAPQVQFITSEFNFDGKVVKGAPYSAEGVTETVQILGDGNRIVRNSSSKVYRDSLGRTRREQALKAVGAWPVSGDAPTTVSINDPVAGTQYTLNTASKTANKMTVQRVTRDVSLANGDKFTVVTRANATGGKVAVNGEVKEVNGGQFTFVTDDNQKIVLTEAGEKAQVEKMAVELKAREMSERMNTVTVAGTGTGVATFSARANTQVNKESLGIQVIEGVQAEGTRITITIPAGEIGNERPIVTVNERWYSPELQTVVMTKNSDPRSGETTFRLTNINRNEPDPSLFQVPADYTVKEGGYAFGTTTPLLRKIEAEKKLKNQNDN